MQQRWISRRFVLGTAALGGLTAVAFLPGCGGGSPGVTPPALTFTPTPGPTARPTPTPGNVAQFAGTYLTSYQGTGDEDGTVRFQVNSAGGATATISSPTQGEVAGTGTVTPLTANTASIRITGTSTGTPSIGVRAVGRAPGVVFTFTGLLTNSNGTVTFAGSFTAGNTSGTVTGAKALSTNPFAGTYNGTLTAPTTSTFVLTVHADFTLSLTGTANGIPFTATGSIAPTGPSAAHFTLTGSAPNGSLISLTGNVQLSGSNGLTGSGKVLRDGVQIGTFSFSGTGSGGGGGTP